MDLSQIDYSKIIIDTINTLISTMFNSIDNILYSLLDNIAFIDTSIIDNEFFDSALGSSVSNGIIAIANSLLIAFSIYYCSKLMLSSYTASNIESPYQFVFNAIIFAICINYSQFLCKEIIYINFLLTDAIHNLGSYLFNANISFNNLISQMNSFIYVTSESFNLFSFDGIVESFISVGLLNLLFSYSLRYIMVQVFILLSPFAFLCLINQSTSWFFKTWFRSFLSLLLIQPFISLILLIIFSFNTSFSSTLSQLMYIGAIYALGKSNNFIRELIGGISTDVHSNINSFKTLIK